MELISKKELLATTGISYGALYRWKRMKLIPEEWFIRKNSETGPETYFEKDKILPRIEQIKARGDIPLDELAKRFSGKAPEISLTPKVCGVSKEIIEYTGLSDEERLDFYNVFYLRFCDKLLDDGVLTDSDAKGFYEFMQNEYKNFPQLPAVTIVRKKGLTLSVLHPQNTKISPDGKIIFSSETAAFFAQTAAEFGGVVI